jgi:hypothetical protein
MQGQDNQTRRMFSYASRGMDSVEIADYCSMMGWTSDPVIAALVDRLLIQEEALARSQIEEEFQEESASLAQVVQENHDKTRKQITSLFKKASHRGQVAPRPGPQEKYRPVILAILKRQGPLKRSDLVKKVLLMCPSAGKGSIYRSITSAKEDREIIAIGKIFYSPK